MDRIGRWMEGNLDSMPSFAVTDRWRQDPFGALRWKTLSEADVLGMKRGSELSDWTDTHRGMDKGLLRIGERMNCPVPEIRLKKWIENKTRTGPVSTTKDRGRPNGEHWGDQNDD